MAKKNTKVQKNKKSKKGKKKGLGFFGIIYALFISVGAVLMMPTTLIFIIGMVPTAVAAFTDRTKERTAAMTVGAMNFAGVLPALLHLWKNGHVVENALNIISQPTMLLYMYGGAGIGMLIYLNAPPIVSNFLKRKGLRRLEKIEKRHKELVERWGIIVTGTDPDADDKKAED